MKLEMIDKYLLFGGGAILAWFSLELKKLRKEVLVVTSSRHSNNVVSEDGTILEEYLLENEIEYVVVDDINVDEITREITFNSLGLSFGAAWIFRKEFIDCFNGRLFNLHGARLPRDRGAGGFSWQILCDNRLGCCLIHQIDPGVDTGPILKYDEFLYPSWCRVPEDYIKVYIQKNRKFLSEFVKEIDNKKEFKCVEQLNYLSTYWPRLSTEYHGYINWNWNLRQIERFICAFDEPYKGASTYIRDKRVFLKSVFVDYSDGLFHPFQTGIIYKKTSGVLFVAAKQGSLVIGSVTDEAGNNLMDEVRVGDRFFTPIGLCEKARIFHAIYTPKGLEV